YINIQAKTISVFENINAEVANSTNYSTIHLHGDSVTLDNAVVSATFFGVDADNGMIKLNNATRVIGPVGFGYGSGYTYLIASGGIHQAPDSTVKNLSVSGSYSLSLQSGGEINLAGANNNLGRIAISTTNGASATVKNRGVLTIVDINTGTGNVTINNTGATTIAAGRNGYPSITANSFTLNNTDGVVTQETLTQSNRAVSFQIGVYYQTREATINLLGSSTLQAPANFKFLNNYSSIAGNGPDEGFLVDSPDHPERNLFLYSTGY
ncbi:MAG: hypothetical protein ORO03_07255, partial [Alphaproteobacteria bacterium]|nr:hypothetical protein [Alphaproteobacteria bacterium]